MLFWQPDLAKTLAVDKLQLEQRPYQADQLLHTLLGQLGISGTLYDEKHDILSRGFDSKAAPPRLMGKIPYDQ